MNEAKKLLNGLKKKDKEYCEQVNNNLLKNIVETMHREKFNEIEFTEKSLTHTVFIEDDKSLQSIFVIVEENVHDLVHHSGKMRREVHDGFYFFPKVKSTWGSYKAFNEEVSILCQNADWFEKKGLKITLSHHESNYMKSRELKIIGWKRKYLIFKTPMFKEVRECLPVKLRSVTVSLKGSR